MAVGVERQADLRVPERLHDGSRVNALCEQQRRRRVPQIVKPDGRQACGPEQHVKLPAHVPRAADISRGDPLQTEAPAAP